MDTNGAWNKNVSSLIFKKMHTGLVRFVLRPICVVGFVPGSAFEGTTGKSFWRSDTE